MAPLCGAAVFDAKMPFHTFSAAKGGVVLCTTNKIMAYHILIEEQYYNTKKEAENIRKKHILCLLACSAVLLFLFTGCGNYFRYAPGTELFPPLETEGETTVPPGTTTQETTADSLLENGVYTCTLYSLTVPAGWSCDGYDSSVEITAPEPINDMVPSISVTVGPCEGDLSKIKYDDMKKNFGTLLENIEKISFGMKTIGENECLIVEYSYTVMGMKQFISQVIVHANNQDITFTLVRDSLLTASAEFNEMMKSLEISPLAKGQP